MASTKTRSGVPVTPTITTTGVPGTSDQVRTFVGQYVRPCVVTNTDPTNVVYVLVNEEDASVTAFMVSLAALQAVDVSFGGRVNVASVSLYMAAGAYSSILVKGWLP